MTPTPTTLVLAFVAVVFICVFAGAAIGALATRDRQTVRAAETRFAEAETVPFQVAVPVSPAGPAPQHYWTAPLAVVDSLRLDMPGPDVDRRDTDAAALPAYADVVMVQYPDRSGAAYLPTLPPPPPHPDAPDQGGSIWGPRIAALAARLRGSPQHRYVSRHRLDNSRHNWPTVNAATSRTVRP